MTTTAREQHSKSHHNCASMQTHQAVRIGFEPATESIQSYVFSTRLRYNGYRLKAKYQIKAVNLTPVHSSHVFSKARVHSSASPILCVWLERQAVEAHT